MKRSTASVAAALVVLVAASTTPAMVSAASPQVPPDEVAQLTAGKQLISDTETSVYLIVVDGEPAATYRGGIDGLPATITGGARIDRTSPDVSAYLTHLTGVHDTILDAAGVDPTAKLYSYGFAVNGFAAALTPDQATRLVGDPAVRGVFPDEIRRTMSTSGSTTTESATTDASPDFLELSHQQGPWAAGYTGDGVVVGIIDTGIWPEHPSFAADGLRPAPASFHGTGCAFGSDTAAAPAFNPADEDFACNEKLLAAKVYGLGFHGGTGTGLATREFLSARDADGHGSHTAATAAGNQGVEAAVLGADWGRASGIAPRARLSVYKACWQTGATAGGCALSDLVAAIDDAVGDGVDVINYSVGSTTSDLGVDDLAFLRADATGILVAAAAGNTGASGSPPWVTSVAAATQKRTLGAVLTLGNESTLTGVSVTGGTDLVRLVDGADLGNATCAPDPGFPDGAADGAIVLCRSGDGPTISKSATIARAGGAAMVLVASNDGATLDPANHHVPSLHVTHSQGEEIAAYIAETGDAADAALTGGIATEGDTSVMADFSSRGPNRLSGDVLKPDLVAPGVDILAAHTPRALSGAPDQMFHAVSGTSTASAHVAGAYAMLRQANPDWTPAMVRSALATSARQDVLQSDGDTGADAFDMGSGYIQPGGIIWRRGSAFNPGLVYDTGLDGYTAFACAEELTGFATACPADTSSADSSPEGSDLNLPSIAIEDLAGSRTVTRTVTSVADKTRTFESQVRAPAGFRVEVTPATLTLDPGETAGFTVTITRTNRGVGKWTPGSLTWNSAGYRIVSPIVVRAVDMATPGETAATGARGSVPIPVTLGYEGLYDATAHALVPPVTEDGTVADDPTGDINTALTASAGVRVHSVSVPAGTVKARIALFDAAVDGEHDLDLYVFTPDGTFVGGSAGGTAEEHVDFVPGEWASYLVAVHGWQTDGASADYTLHSWMIPDGSDGSLAVDTGTKSLRPGDHVTTEATWKGLEPGIRYVGAVSHVRTVSEGETETLGITMVAVDTTDPTRTPARPTLVPDRLVGG